MPELSVVIVSWNTRDMLERCLDSLRDAVAHLDVETLVIDNGSGDETLAMLHGRPDVARIVANPDNRGFAAANNQGLELAGAPVVLLLNSDAFISRDAIDRSMRLFEVHQRAGIVGPKILNSDGSIQAEGDRFPTLVQDILTSAGLDQLRRRAERYETRPTRVDWVHGACMFVRSTAVKSVGGLDTRFFMYSEEVDWCHRFRERGWEIWYDPAASVVHLGGASSIGDDLRRRTALYRSRIGLRRRLSGPVASCALWLSMLCGLSARTCARGVLRLTAKREIGRHSAFADLRLLRAVAASDPFARWAVS